MIRFIVLFGLIYFGYRSLKIWALNHLAAGARTVCGGAEEVADDVMVQDPYCQVYFPRREGVFLNKNGRTLSFCSARCRDAYIMNRSQKKSQEEHLQ